MVVFCRMGFVVASASLPAVEEVHPVLILIRLYFGCIRICVLYIGCILSEANGFCCGKCQSASCGRSAPSFNTDPVIAPKLDLSSCSSKMSDGHNWWHLISAYPNSP